MEAEYEVVSTTVVKLTLWQSLLMELAVPFFTLPTVWWDNIGATYPSVNPVFQSSTKYIENDFHFVSDNVAHRDLAFKYVSASDQIADILTKGISNPQFSNFRSKLNVVDGTFILQERVKDAASAYPKGIHTKSKPPPHNLPYYDNIEML